MSMQWWDGQRERRREGGRNTHTPTHTWNLGLPHSLSTDSLQSGLAHNRSSKSVTSYLHTHTHNSTQHAHHSARPHGNHQSLNKRSSSVPVPTNDIGVQRYSRSGQPTGRRELGKKPTKLDRLDPQCAHNVIRFRWISLPVRFPLPWLLPTTQSSAGDLQSALVLKFCQLGGLARAS